MPSATVATFDYNSVPAKDRKWLKGVTEQIKSSTNRVRGDLIAIGQWIAEAKERLPHGAFESWCKAELPWGLTTAWKLTQVAKVFAPKPSPGESEAPRTPPAVERIEPTALYTLSTPSCPPEAREKAIALAESGQTITAERARELIDAARESDPPRNRGTPVMRCLQDLIDNVEAAIEDGRINPVDVPEPPADMPLPIPLWMLARLYAILFPEEFPEEHREPSPVDEPPGSDAKIAVMRRRAEVGLALCGSRDPGLDDPRGVRYEKRPGGAGRVVDGVRQPPPPKPVGWVRAR